MNPARPSDGAQVTRPRVLLVEDDPSLRRFVRMALDELPIELIECDSVSAAVQALTDAPVHMILTDLMMPGESGFGLLQRLQSTPALGGAAKVVVLSAGLNANVRGQLEPFNTWRLLSKPVSVSLLEACVKEALNDMTPTPTPAGSPTAEPATAPALQGNAAEQAQAIEDYFEGDAELFASYREACLAQFPVDVQEGQTACQSGDMPVLRRVAHSLKTVLLTLGYPAWSELARNIEAQAEAGDPAAARADWARLIAHLQTLQPTA